MDIKNWTVTVSPPTTDQNNKVNVTVTYVYNDGTNSYAPIVDNYSGILSNNDLISLIQTNLTAHDQTVQGLLNVPAIVVGQIDLTQLFPQPVPAPILTTASTISPAPSQSISPSA